MGRQQDEQPEGPAQVQESPRLTLHTRNATVESYRAAAGCGPPQARRLARPGRNEAA